MSRKNKGWTRNHHPIFGDKAEILQTTTGGDVWQFRCFISEEKKYVRKSLRTKDLDTALIRGEKLFLELYSDLQAGKKLFGLKLYELFDTFIEYKFRHIESGVITSGRLTTIKSQLKHFLEYKGFKTKISELDRRSAFEYGHYRRKQGAKDVTIRNEQATINAMFRYGMDNGLCNLGQLEFDVIRIREAGRRDTFTLKEYKDLFTYMRSWSSKKNNDEQQTRLEKLLIRDYILILANTMLRTGEALQLRWSDLVTTNYANDSSKYQLVEINVRAEISKNRKSRPVISRGGTYFDRLRRRLEDVSPNDYVFADAQDGAKQFPKRRLYAYWDELMGAIGIDYKKRNITYYSLRHFGITARLSAGVSVWDVASIAGTGVSFIESHYGHSRKEMMVEAAFKDVNKSDKDIRMLVE